MTAQADTSCLKAGVRLTVREVILRYTYAVSLPLLLSRLSQASKAMLLFFVVAVRATKMRKAIRVGGYL